MVDMKRLDKVENLAPCPFCGVELIPREEIWRNPISGFTGKNLVYSHPKTNCVLDYARYHFYAHPELIGAWNRRIYTDMDGRKEHGR